MIVIAESNFVLELALQQEGRADVERLVRMAERREIDLVIPACALFEPYETLIRRRKVRHVTADRLYNQLLQLSRSKAFEHLPETALLVVDALRASTELEAAGLDDVIRRLLGCSVVPALSPSILWRALSARVQFELGPQDAIVFASVEEHARERATEPKVFVTETQLILESPRYKRISLT